MVKTKTLFEEMTSSYFLYFSWLELRKFTAHFGKERFTHIPVSLSWFDKMSRLLKKGNYNYSSINIIRVHGNSKIITSEFFCFKNKIVENAIYNAIFPFIKFKQIHSRLLLKQL